MKKNIFTSINPFTEKLVGKTIGFSDVDIENALSLSEKAFTSWSNYSLEKKTDIVQKLMVELDKNKNQLATLITKEMGKPIKQSIAEVEKCIKLCDYVIKQSPIALADKTNIPQAPSGSYVIYKPLGVIMGIMPWNFPFWQVFRFALPTLISGNTVLVKKAPNVMLCGVELEKLFIAAGFPIGVYQNLPISVEQVPLIIADDRVKGVSLTGSVEAGRSVATLAGKHLKKTLLELGGSDPYIVLDSADLKIASKECALSRMNNAGQSCIAAKRIIVTKKVEEEFIRLLIEEMRFYNMGDPLSINSHLGPLAREDLRNNLHSQVQALMKKKAQVLLGGKIPSRKGYFYPATVLKISADHVRSFDEELFGPVALVIVASHEEEALKIANDSSYGLGAVVFSQEEKKAKKWVHDLLQAGSGSVNKVLHSHPALPFGGIKNSGYGRELSFQGFYEFVNIKTIFCG